jgi:iron complex outermembrane receptor protein
MTLYRDGLPGDQYGHGSSMEDTEKLEMLNGLSGFLYGAANVGGMVNYVSKRPSSTRLNELSLGSSGGQSWSGAVDLGGPIDTEGRWGYRLNLAKQGGETAIDSLKIQKEFISLALDWHILDNLLLQVDAMHRDYDVYGNTADWLFASGVSRLDAKRINNAVSWGQPWMNNHYESKRYGAHLTWNINPFAALRMSYLDSYSSRKTQSATNTVQADGSFSQSVSRIYADGQNRVTSRQYDQSAAGYLDLSFATGAISHKLTVGLQQVNNIQRRYQREAGSVSSYSSVDYQSPIYIAQPTGTVVDRGRLTKRSDTTNSSWLIGDDVRFNHQWSALLGLAYVNIQNHVSDYDASKLSPNISIIYQPWPQFSTYMTYIEALENGGTAPETDNGRTVVNAGTVFDPLSSQQLEIGSKYTWNQRLALNTALFKIDKGLQYSQMIDSETSRYVQSGRQVHQGIEVTATGKITENLTLLGGFTWLDAKVKEQKQNKALENKRPAEVAKQIMKLYVEYQLPNVQHLSLNAGVNYTGKRYADSLNTDVMPSYSLFNLGARYQFKLDEDPITLRANLNNAFNKHYWANSSILGDPRSIVISATLQF